MAERFPVKVDAEFKSADCFWAKPPADSEVAALKAWIGGDSSREQDAVELARFAALKWESTCEYGSVVASLDALEAAIRADSKVEVTAMVIATAKWFDGGLLGVCLFHRTWAGNVFVDFLATHPGAAGQIRGVGYGLLYHLCDASRRLKAPLLWGETTADSALFYEKAFDLKNLGDKIEVSNKQQHAFCQLMEQKWKGGR